MHLTGKTILDGYVSISRISNLKTDAPEVEREFMAGKSGAQRSERPFTAQFGRIMGLEQSLNNEVMCSGGLIGITKRDEARDRWFVTNHVRSIISAKLMEMAHHDSSPRPKHGEDLKSCSAADYHAVCGLVKKLQNEMKNPSDSTGPAAVALTNVCTGANPTSKSAEKILDDLGKESLDQFVKKQLVTGEVEFFAPISRVNIPPFIEKENKNTAKNKVDSLVSDRALLALFGKLIIAAQYRKIDLNKLFCHELADVPLSLADRQGDMRRYA